ncbi:hypothetical protein D1007_38548 [Hordeum vulgare]|nr:hypothetical protein D1007_38548 [Hordeum vulgare]
MTITLEDIAMITGLSIEGRALTGKVKSHGWRQRVATLRNARVEIDQIPDTDEAAYLRHLEWIRKEFKVIHKGAWTRSDCLDNSVRETIGAHLDYGRLHDRVGTELWISINDSNVMLGHAPGPETDRLVRKGHQSMPHTTALLSCHGSSSTDVRARAQYIMDVLSSARPSSSRPHDSSARSSSSGAHGSSRRAQFEEDEQEEETDKEADPDYMELGASQTEDSPQPTQPTQSTKETHRASSRNIRCPSWRNTPEGYVNKGKIPAKRGKK